MKNYDHKEIATTWRAGITKAGLKMKDMGITWSRMEDLTEKNENQHQITFTLTTMMFFRPQNH